MFSDRASTEWQNLSLKKITIRINARRSGFLDKNLKTDMKYSIIKHHIWHETFVNPNNLFNHDCLMPFCHFQENQMQLVSLHGYVTGGRRK